MTGKSQSQETPNKSSLMREFYSNFQLEQLTKKKVRGPGPTQPLSSSAIAKLNLVKIHQNNNTRSYTDGIYFDKLKRHELMKRKTATPKVVDHSLHYSSIFEREMIDSSSKDLRSTDA